MLGSRIDFTYNKAQTLLFQRGFGFALERIQIAHRRCALNPAIRATAARSVFPAVAVGSLIRVPL